MAHQVLVARAHRRDLRVDVVEQHLLGVRPPDPARIQLAQGLGLLARGERLVDLEQRRAFGVLGLARRARVGDDGEDRLAHLLARCEQADHVVVALAHLAAVQPGQQRHRIVHRRLGQHQVLAIQVVEALRHVARHLDVLDLVAPDRDLVRLEHQDVRGHQHRVHEEAHRHVGIDVDTGGGVLVHLRLVRMGAIEHALAGHAGEQPRELRDLGDVGLAIEEHPRRIQARGQPARGDLQRGALDARGLVALDQRVVVGQEIEVLGTGTAAGLHGGADRADVVADVRRAAGGDAGEVADDGSAHGFSQAGSSGATAAGPGSCSPGRSAGRASRN